MINVIDKIRMHGEIKEPIEFSLKDTVFFVCVLPRSADDMDMPILNAMLAGEFEYTDCPFPANCWGPILVKKLNVIDENLQKYRLFWGY